MENKEKFWKRFYQAMIVILAVAIIVVIVCAAKVKNAQETPETSQSSTPKEEKLFAGFAKPEEVVTVNTQIIEDGLREMGTLITEEYYFTQVEEYSSTTKIWILDSTSKFTYSYDGTVSAGIDCNAITVDRDDENGKITVHVPKARILNVNIDHNSFKIYEEKNGLWNKIDMTKYNDSLVQFEEAAKTKALEKGILNKADEGADKMLASFIGAIIDTEEYTVEFVKE